MAMAALNGATMPMRVLGNTGIQVSVLSFGFWATFGVKEGLMCDRQGVDKAKEILRIARNAGINLFDNAETYGSPQGAAESVMGQAIEELTEEDPEKWKRSTLVLTTKIFWGGSDVNQKGLSRKHIIEGMDASLKRLRVPYVDLVFCHRPDACTPTESVVRGMSDLVRTGKCFNWGTSEWSAQQITEAFFLARELGLEPPMFEQPQYNMFWRDRCEKEYFPLYRQPYFMGTTIWSPLASGLLTGKYSKGKIPKGSRADQEGYEFVANKVQTWQEDGKLATVDKLEEYAATKLQCSVGQLAIAWCLRNANVSTVLLGATKAEQLEENLGSVGVAKRMSPADDAAIELLLKNKPEDWQGFGGAGMRAYTRMEATDFPMRIPNYVLPPTQPKM